MLTGWLTQEGFGVFSWERGLLECVRGLDRSAKRA